MGNFQEKQNDPDHDPSHGPQVKIDLRVFNRNTGESVTGDYVVKDMKGFNETGFQPLLLKNLADAGYDIPTTVQRCTIPIIMAGRDLMACAETGT